jgi:hypothetical protein
MGRRAVHFIKVTAVFAGCGALCAWGMSALGLTGALRWPLAAALAFGSCLVVFAAAGRRLARRGQPPGVTPQAHAAAPGTSRPLAGASSGAIVRPATAAGLGGALVGASAWAADSAGTTDADAWAASSGLAINPATGLPMVGPGSAGVDVGGNVYGTTSNDAFGASDISHGGFDAGGDFGGSPSHHDPW